MSEITETQYSAIIAFCEKLTERLEGNEGDFDRNVELNNLFETAIRDHLYEDDENSQKVRTALIHEIAETFGFLTE